MEQDNGHVEEIIKWCPLLKEWCSKDVRERCAFNTEMARNTGGLQQKFGMCSFNAVVMILSEINIKTVPPQQEIQLPGLYRG